jgi:Sec-independent protein translocase protein TatA
MITDLLVTLFVAILVVASLHLSRMGDALGRLVRRDGRGGDRRP